MVPDNTVLCIGCFGTYDWKMQGRANLPRYACHVPVGMILHLFHITSVQHWVAVRCSPLVPDICWPRPCVMSVCEWSAGTNLTELCSCGSCHSTLTCVCAVNRGVTAPKCRYGRDILTRGSPVLTPLLITWLLVNYVAAAFVDLIHPPPVLAALGLWGCGHEGTVLAGLPLLLQMLATLAVAGVQTRSAYASN